MEGIHFGTSGWRAILAEEFTFPTARLVCQGIAEYLQQEGIGSRGVIVGYDARFLGEQFARAAAEVLAGNGIPTLLCNRETPTPAIAYHILHRRLAGGINISASHNPAEYNGIKFTPAWGGPALPETTQAIEHRVSALLQANESAKRLPWPEAEATGLSRLYDPQPDFLAGVEQHVDLAVIQRAGLTLVVDPLYGTTRGYLDELLRKAGARVTVLHNWRDPYFGGRRPDPAGEVVEELQAAVRRENAHLGLATDGDGDRFGIVDQDGTFIEANRILGLLVDYLIRHRGWHGGVARSVATTHLVDAVAKAHGATVHETQVGFKFIGELLAKGEAFFGGEESAGLSIQGHVPDKDGVLACLLVAEMVAREGKSLHDLLASLYQRVGEVYTRREDVVLDASLRDRLARTLEHPPESFGGTRVAHVNRLDGCKLLMDDGSWFLFRLSGTEPIVRCYGEAASREQLEALMKAGRTLIHGGA